MSTNDIRIELSETAATWMAGESLAGRYVLNDPFKPYFEVLNTPCKHNATVVMPADHRHHKGMMYSLKCADLNFWEEDPGQPSCGIQRILETRVEGETLRQELLWCREDGSLPTYEETRRIRCAPSSDGRGFSWEWETRRKALREHRLVKSAWSIKKPNGELVNYHGLGIRLPWSWAGDWVSGVQMDGRSMEPDEAAGSVARAATFFGWFDGKWSPDGGAVTIVQDHGFGWFVLKAAFAYLATGPSVSEELDVAAGQMFEERYTILVEARIEARSH